MYAQQTSPDHSSQHDGAKEEGVSPGHPPEPRNKRIFFIIPNYRTFPSLTYYKPLTAKEKFKIASQDAFDPGTFVLAAAIAGEGQLSNSNPSFGQGVKGYAHYWATSYADFASGDYLTEAIYPTLLHQDPRYFRRGSGGAWARLGYAVGQIFWTHKDSGGTQFNFSEVAGNATSVAMSNAYYREGRNATDAATRLVTQLGIDAASNVLKEFWPDISNKFSRDHHSVKP